MGPTLRATSNESSSGSESNSEIDDDKKRDPSWVQENSTVLLSVASVVLASILAGIFTLLGSQIGAGGALNAGIAQQQAVRESTQSEESRKKRGEVYAAMLDSAESYRILVAEVAGSSPLQLAPERLEDIRNGNKDIGSKLNMVYIYGSDEGLVATLDLVDTVGVDILSVASLNEYVFQKLDEKEYNEAFAKLRRVMCREASAQPRASCLN